jgi:hypothetical protein
MDAAFRVSTHRIMLSCRIYPIISHASRHGWVFTLLLHCPIASSPESICFPLRRRLRVLLLTPEVQIQATCALNCWLRSNTSDIFNHWKFRKHKLQESDAAASLGIMLFRKWDSTNKSLPTKPMPIAIKHKLSLHFILMFIARISALIFSTSFRCIHTMGINQKSTTKPMQSTYILFIFYWMFLARISASIFSTSSGASTPWASWSTLITYNYEKQTETKVSALGYQLQTVSL